MDGKSEGKKNIHTIQRNATNNQKKKKKQEEPNTFFTSKLCVAFFGQTHTHGLISMSNGATKHNGNLSKFHNDIPLHVFGWGLSISL